MQNFIDPAILFFVYGVFAGAVRSDLEIPPAVAKFLSLYLLMALGLKGGFALAKSGLTVDVGLTLLAAVAMAFLVPILGYSILKRFVEKFDAAAVSAAYGSVSAVTFVTTIQFLDTAGIPFGGHMPVAMVLMESPAIIVAVVLANSMRKTQHTAVSHILHESLTNGAHMLLIGGMIVGLLSGDAGQAVMQPFSVDLFKGMLAFFLLDMGLMVARNFSDARKASPALLAYALAAPLVHAAIALGFARVMGMPVGDAILLMVLSASASYIVVPAVLRDAIPEANPAIYFGLSLGITFPFNLLVGIPLYARMAQAVLVP